MLLEETPTKVMTLLGVALTSLVMLFVFTATDASFSGSQTSVYDPVSLDKVVSVIDNTALGYSNFLQANLIKPMGEQLAMVTDNVSWVTDNAQDGLYSMLGVPNNSSDDSVAAPASYTGTVAGAHTTKYGSRGIVDSVFSVFLQQ